MREGEAPSYFNPVEASVLVDLVAGLLQQHERTAVGVTTSDIGVIATYRKQACGCVWQPLTHVARGCNKESAELPQGNDPPAMQTTRASTR